MRRLGFWLWTLLSFMVILPVTGVIQGILTPFELAYNYVKFGKDGYELEDYWHTYANNVINKYSTWFEI